MKMARVLDNGNLQLPPEVTDRLCVKAGDSVAIEIETDGMVRLYPNPATIDEVYGILEPPEGVHLTVEQMAQAIAEGFQKRET
ncbi:MAG TPA: hypothetical protein ENN80_04225 [Candidatus Hydrogenedentes bacterium]|nr:hypothetical protein [Candidatus Hydrogenedentota bacterium]